MPENPALDDLERILTAVRRELDSPEEAGALLDDAFTVTATLRSRTVELDDPERALTAALAAAQGAFPPIPKTKSATVIPKGGGASYKYAYADLADVLAAVRPVLAREGLALTQPTVYTEGGRLLLTTVLRHVGGGRLTSTIELTQSPSSPQSFGGALTYLRRYEVTTLLGIQADEDTDGQHVEPAGPPAARPEPLPAWAHPASDARKRELVECLEPIIGRDRAKTLGRSIADSWGHVPDGLAAFSKALLAHLEANAQDARAEASPPEPAPEPEPEPDPPSPEELAAAPANDDGPLPGSVVVEDLPDDPVRRVAALKAAGCRCAEPLSPDRYAADCPIAGHGIPF